MTDQRNDDQRAAYTAGLRALADVLDNHPELPLPYEGTRMSLAQRMSFNFLSEDDPRPAMAAARRALGVPMEKDDSIEGYYKLKGSLHGLHFQLTAFRNVVCERVVTGTRKVEIEEHDPAALAALPKVKKTVTIEDVEWRCAPLLGGDA